MVRRISTTIAALAVALMIYAFFTGAIYRQVMIKLVHVGCIHDRTTPAASGANTAPQTIPILGVQVPLSAILAAAATVIAMPFVATFMHHYRRRRRYLNDECIECGHPITKWRGRCPGCGVRIGPG